MSMVDVAILLASFFSSILVVALGVFINKKAKNLADRTEFTKLKIELTENTKIIEKVKSDFLEANTQIVEKVRTEFLEVNTKIVENVRSEFLRNNTEVVESVKSELQVKGWVNQQVWLRKQETYESIFDKLLLIKKHATHQSNEFQKDLEIERSDQDYYISQDAERIDSSSHQRDLDRKRENRKKQVNSKEHIVKTKEIETDKEKAISSLIEMASINSVYIDDDVETVLKELQSVMNQRFSSSDVDEIENHIVDVSREIDKAIEDVKSACRKELKIKT